MANVISLAEKFLPILDDVYKQASKSSILDVTDNNRIRFRGANKVELFKTSMDGLADYSRNSGYVNGSVVAGWEDYTLTKDRGTSFMVDSMDDEETMGLAFGTLAGEFIRTHVVPEIDAYRFAAISGTSGVTTASAADITVGTTDVPGLVDTGIQTMTDDEVPEEGRILFLSETAYNGLQSKIARTVLNGERGISSIIESYEGMRIIRVPQSRFMDTITLNDGSTKFGYTVPATAKKLNFMIVHPSAILQVTKHELPRIFSPQINQMANAWKFDYRIYHDVFVLDQKLKGVYVHAGNTAIGTAADY